MTHALINLAACAYGLVYVAHRRGRRLPLPPWMHEVAAIFRDGQQFAREDAEASRTHPHAATDVGPQSNPIEEASPWVIFKSSAPNAIRP